MPTRIEGEKQSKVWLHNNRWASPAGENVTRKKIGVRKHKQQREGDSSLFFPLLPLIS